MKRKILVVEDERSLRQILCENLKFDGYEPIAAGSGKDALALASKERPDLAIIDIGLPDMDGWTLLKRLRSLASASDIRFLMLSGNFGDELNHLPEGIGPDNLVAKPYEYEQLIEKIRQQLPAD